MSAIISACGRYRYRLEREVQLAGVVVAWFGVNPSTADAQLEDHTTQKWRGFTLRHGGRRYLAGNAFAFRAKNVNALAAAADPVGPDNAEHLQRIIAEADVLMPCWGSRTKIPRVLRPHLDALAQRLWASGKPVRALGLTATGDPAHPLVLGYDTPLVDWRPS